VGSLESTAGSRLAPILSRYHSVYPDVVVELATGTTGALVTRVVNYELEAAFVSEPFTAPSLQARRVFEEQLVLVTSKAISKVSGPADLGRSTLIAFAQGCSYRKRIEEWLGSANVMPERIMEFASYQTMIACVAAGTGFAVVPKSVLEALRATKSVRQHASRSDFRTTAPISCGVAIHRYRCSACYRFWALPPHDGSPPAH
jgi:DNA-binding transcriptional LysR family regulator